MIGFLRSLVHRLTTFHPMAERICDDPMIMWCPCCKLAWDAGIDWEGLRPNPPRAKPRKPNR